ncbi:MAG: hypothetical protein LV479_06915 [Methylacidiphilales bacterium]|nr:hypothetical protein [Candidatus Methylacidiphilales bacterium]
MATITRGGVTPEVAVFADGTGDAAGASTPGFGITFVFGRCVSGTSIPPVRAAAGWVENFCGKSGVVLELGGAPVKGGADGFGAEGIEPEAGLAILGIGFVTAVDQAGGADATGSAVPPGVIGSVVAAEMFGRIFETIFVESGFRGRGGRLMRRVSRWGTLGSVPESAESAIINPFYNYFGKCSIVKFAIVTYLWFYMICACQNKEFPGYIYRYCRLSGGES